MVLSAVCVYSVDTRDKEHPIHTSRYLVQDLIQIGS